MSFQAYLDNIEAKIGKSPEELINLGTERGFLENRKLKKEVKAGEVVTWLREEYDLGHGHAMAIFAYYKGKRE